MTYDELMNFFGTLSEMDSLDSSTLSAATAFITDLNTNAASSAEEVARLAAENETLKTKNYELTKAAPAVIDPEPEPVDEAENVTFEDIFKAV